MSALLQLKSVLATRKKIISIYSVCLFIAWASFDKWYLVTLVIYYSQRLLYTREEGNSSNTDVSYEE